MAPTEVEMDARTDVPHRLGNVGSDTADVEELAVPIDDCATPGLHQQTLGKVHPDVGTGDPAENEIGAVDRRAVHGPIETFGSNGRTQHEGVDTDAERRASPSGGSNDRFSTPKDTTPPPTWLERVRRRAEPLFTNSRIAHAAKDCRAYGRCTRSPRGRPRLEARRSSRHAAGSNGMTRAS